MGLMLIWEEGKKRKKEKKKKNKQTKKQLTIFSNYWNFVFDLKSKVDKFLYLFHYTCLTQSIFQSLEDKSFCGNFLNAIGK